MRKTLRLVLAGLFVFVFAFSLVVTLEQDAQAKEQYSCCSYLVKTGPITQTGHGVWFNNWCYCLLDVPGQNPNGCELYCPPIY